MAETVGDVCECVDVLRGGAVLGRFSHSGVQGGRGAGDVSWALVC